MYLEQLVQIKSDLEEVVGILGPIRKDSDEGQMGIKAKAELKTLVRLIDELSQQTQRSSATLQGMSGNSASKIASRSLNRSSISGLSALTSVILEDRYASGRKSICI